MPYAAVDLSNAGEMSREEKNLRKRLGLREDIYNHNSGLHEKDNSRDLPTLLRNLHIRPTESNC